jgi:hydrogenase maturation protein HypF
MGEECPVAVPDPIVRGAWERRLNAPQSSAAGRVFDAAAAVILGVGETSFEGQGPMWLEALAQASPEFPQMSLAADATGLQRIDWAPMMAWLRARSDLDPATRAGAVHAAFADAIVRVAEAQRDATGCAVVGLTGGVFQNRLLSELAAGQLGEKGFRVLLPALIPANDGGLSYGQVADFIGRNR